MTIGNRIRQARNRKGYSQEYVADACNFRRAATAKSKRMRYG